MIADAAPGLSVTAANVTGSGVLMPGETFLGGPLTFRNSWRRRVDIGFAPEGLAEIGLVLKAVVTADRKPWQFGDPLSHGVTGAGRWQQNQTSALTAQFALLDSRLRYSGGISSSRYGEADVSASLTPDNPLYRQPKPSRSSMHWHRLDAALWDTATSKAAAWLSYAGAGQGYRNLQQTADMPVVLDGRTVEFGTNISSGRARLALLRRDEVSHYGSSGLTRGSLTLGPLRLTLSREDRDAGDYFAGNGWRSRRGQSKAAARIALRDIVPSDGLAALLPDAVTLKLSRSRRESGMPGGLSLVDSSRLGVEMARTRGKSVTRIGFARGATRRSARSAGEGTKIDETWFDFSHSVTGRRWDLTAYGSVALRKSAGRTDRFYYGGMSLSVDGDNRPKISIGIDADYYASRGESAVSDLANQGVNISATADFSYLLNPQGQPASRYLKVKAYTDWSKTEFYGEPGRGRMVPTVLAMLGMQF